MSTPTLQLLHHELPTTRQDVITAICTYEYVSVREAAQLLEKRKSRMYAMVAEGLLDDVGFLVLRTKKGRIWIGIPRYGGSQLVLTERKEGP